MRCFQASLFRDLALVVFFCGLAEVSLSVVELLMQKIHREICRVDAGILAAVRSGSRFGIVISMLFALVQVKYGQTDV